MKTRREFLAQAPLGLLGAVVAGRAGAQAASASVTPPPGSPGAFNTAPPVGPALNSATFAEAEKLEQVTLTDAQRAMAASSWPTSMADLLERRTGPNKVALADSLSPATVWNPILAGQHVGPAHERFVPSRVPRRHCRRMTRTSRSRR